MAEKLSIQIALEGGDEIAKQLEGIGEAGQKAFADIAKSAEDVGGFKNIKPEEVTKKLQEMGVTGVDTIKKIQNAVASASKLETLVQGITSVETAFSALAKAAPIIGAVIVAAFAAATKAASAFADAVNKVSDEATKLGVSIEKVDQFRAALEQAGISAQGISTALTQAKEHADQFKLDQVKRDAAEVQRALTGGFGGGEAFKRLQQAADEFTPAGKAAREELVKMNQAVPGIGEGLQRLGDPISGLKVTTKDVQELGVELAKLKTLGIDIKVNDDAVTQAQKIITVLAQMPDKAKAAQIAMQRFGAAGPEIVAALRNGSLSVEQFGRSYATMTAEQEAAANQQRQTMNQLSADWERFKVQIGAPIAIAGIAGLTAAWDAFKAIITTTGKELNSIATTGAAVISALAAPINALTSAWQSLGTSTDAALAKIGEIARSIASITWDAISSAGVAAWNALTGAIEGAATAVVNFFSKLASGAWDKVKSLLGLGGGAPAAAGMAGGGLLGGRGTGTSDSNLAWVSRGEHIMPARAVAQPGVLALLEALRRSGGNLSRVLDGMGRFALGGMIRSPMPAFAGGGPVGSMSHVTIAFPGLPAISGLRASSDVVDQLHRAAALAQVRSGGRKPSRYS
jgi:hypothetical protein